MKTLMVSALNTAFWFGLHFGVAWFFVLLPQGVQKNIFDYKKKFYVVSKKEMKFYRFIRLPYWKDKLPQYNADFNKRNLTKHITKEYLKEYLAVTCRAEIIHYSIAVLGYISMISCFFFDDPLGNVPIFFVIATLIALCNMPFSLIQRYNRFRLVKVAKSFENK